jgi:hypothetical protein
MDSLIGKRAIQEMIVVMPDANTRLGASWYLNSSTTGRWEDFISRDLVAWTDAHFRTIARRESRGLGGASMGGFGALMIAMRHGDPFSAVYSASTCCTQRVSIFDPGRDRVAWEAVATLRSFSDDDVQVDMLDCALPDLPGSHWLVLSLERQRHPLMRTTHQTGHLASVQACLVEPDDLARAVGDLTSPAARFHSGFPAPDFDSRSLESVLDRHGSAVEDLSDFDRGLSVLMELDHQRN